MLKKIQTQQIKILNPLKSKTPIPIIQITEKEYQDLLDYTIPLTIYLSDDRISYFKKHNVTHFAVICSNPEELPLNVKSVLSHL